MDMTETEQSIINGFLSISHNDVCFWYTAMVGLVRDDSNETPVIPQHLLEESYYKFISHHREYLYQLLPASQGSVIEAHLTRLGEVKKQIDNLRVARVTAKSAQPKKRGWFS